jgi:hypothetical protein
MKTKTVKSAARSLPGSRSTHAKSVSISARVARLEAEVRRLKALLAASPARPRPAPRRRRLLIPNAETIAAMEDPNLVGPFNSVEELLADLNAQDD